MSVTPVNNLEEIAVSEVPEKADVVEEGHTLYAEPIAHVGSLPITNSLVNSWVAVFVVLILAITLHKKIALIPGKIQSVMEMFLEIFLNLFDGVTNNRQKTLRFAPFVLTFFFFILINNWLGIVPGVGSIGLMEQLGGQEVFVPFFRGGTADLNTTLALALIGVVASHIFGVVTIGGWTYFNKFINIKAFLEIPKKIMKEPTIILVNPIKAFVGVVEIIGEAAKVASLSFRLFGNIFAGEVLLASMATLVAVGVPIPFIFLEIIVGLIQALIFSMLILIYLHIATTAEEH
ncbi:hypothetical protein COT94_00760 [Candidatus Falkowbacteria bacterium CG10_big_fil_rev_8_21_14_0_10_37_14]|uniref:ATP synthase subunit a n=1 Tax=Candidatus Falkowbacteria bacterium CG10_big_fil_rev_8_21_14_0_10_37_14 TaxID=1974561 RepID=A0A2M6WU77_9BACT|nr:F0F1 ATP synthase subunit A [Candidatus Falkowbacteria bacterium]PIT96352.1 MAG: hypothetical protein COT94_00760 [Candidatus Falkowbacteria bacterium CG10_big_fil_rev_8_21_14_0_10_37_14]